jgi:LmbE family N-acetylglucosaminyl deacetylase
MRRTLFQQAEQQSLRGDTSTIVFAPHQDDETLACGGTISAKRDLGAPVRIVFMTDGATSHAQFMDAQDLVQIRNVEALDAVRTLGIAEEAVEFLGFPDGRLRSFHETAVARTLEILLRHQPDEVFAPYRWDGVTDHEATCDVVLEAVRLAGREIRVFEYPVWFWNQWPWVSLRLGMNGTAAQDLLRTTRHYWGLRALREFRVCVPVSKYLDSKRQALSMYRSQMTPLKVGWPILSDVSGGEFLENFFQDFETFHCSVGESR